MHKKNTRKNQTIQNPQPIRFSSSAFAKRVHAVVTAIPKGETRSYAEVAHAAGNPGAARAVGTLMRNNFDSTIPCHRVIRADGTPGEYNRGGTPEKVRQLRSEGVSL